MKSSRPVRFGVTGFSFALFALSLAGCSSGGGDNGNPGSGGSASPGSGGSNAGTAGTMGTGGSSSGAGGSSGSAGSGGSAGATGAGGSAGSGGVVGAGGSSGSGGATGGANGGEGGRGGSAAGGRGGSTGGSAGGGGGTAGASGMFSLTSPTQVDGAKFDGKYTCNGGNLGAGINPELDWTGVPAGTKSLAMTFIDTTIGESSPMGQHWAIWNIPWDSTTGKVSMLPEGLTATLTGDLASAKQNGKFLAPCAQMLMNNMDDQYAFTLYALSTTTLNVQGTASVANALTALHAAQPLGTAVLHGHAGLKGK